MRDLPSIERTPNSVTEAWGVVLGFRTGDFERAETVLADPNRVEKGRAERLSLNRLRKRKRTLGTPSLPMLSRRYQ